MEIEMVLVVSSNVARVGYDEEKETLRVEWSNSKGEVTSTWDYVGVPPSAYDNLLQSRSVGKFLKDEIKPYYPGRKVS